MKLRKIAALFLSCALFITGCSTGETATATTKATESNILESSVIAVQTALTETDYRFISIDDPALTDYIKEDVYSYLKANLDSENYIIDSIDVRYVSKEYLEEVAYNSKSNIFFGYTLEELDEEFGDTKYVFTLNEAGQTVVKPFESYDDTYEQIIKGVAIGAGIIIIAVTVIVLVPGAKEVVATKAKKIMATLSNLKPDNFNVSLDDVKSFTKSFIDTAKKEDQSELDMLSALVLSKNKASAIGVLAGTAAVKVGEWVEDNNRSE